MIYAYVEGHEEEALDYFEKLLATTPDASERAEILAMIARLKKILADRSSAPPSEGSFITFSSVSTAGLNALTASAKGPT